LLFANAATPYLLIFGFIQAVLTLVVGIIGVWLACYW